MQIPLNPSHQAERPRLELRSIRLYSTGLKGKVYTNHFYKAMNHNFGVEMKIRNNTFLTQTVRVAGRVYDDQGTEVAKWIGRKYELIGQSEGTYDFYVYESRFATMKEGKYKVQFWVNDKKVQREFFTITYK